MANNETKAFGFMIMFFICLLSYTPLKAELVDIAGNSTLTNAGVNILNTIFGLIWIILTIMWLGLAVYYAMK